MRRFAIALFLVFTLAPCATPAQTSSAPAIGAGVHGYDFLIGTWNCVNQMPSQMMGPANTTLNASALTGAPGLFLHVTGQAFDAVGYLSYDPKTATWSTPVAFGNGTTFETSSQAGAQSVWTGTGTSTQGTVPIRDTFSFSGTNKYSDKTEVQLGGKWQTVANTACTKNS